MTVPAALSINLSEPLWQSTRRDAVERLHADTGLLGYTHSLQAFGGFWTANLTIAADLARVEDWLLRLGWHVVTYDNTLSVVWEGFVNKITVQAGNRTVNLGPLTAIVNRAYLVYSTVDTSVTPPIVGMRTRTSTINNTDSQALYGIRYRALSTGGVPEALAAQIVNRFLAERAWPKVSGNLASDAAGSMSVSVECLGYVHLLDYPYNYTANTGTINLSDAAGTGKLQVVLNACPNSGLFSSNWIRTVNNTTAVRRYENDDRQAINILKELTAIGDGSYNRYIFGIYAGRQAVYNAAPTDVAYYRRLSDPSGRFTTPTGQTVAPWNVQPGQWLFYPDWNVGHSESSSRRHDSWYEFLESVVYTAPASVQTTGGDVDKLPQLLAQLGLSGIGG